MDSLSPGGEAEEQSTYFFSFLPDELYHPEGTIIKNWVDPEDLEYLHPFWWNFRPIEPIWSLCIGTVFGVFGLISIIGNILVISIFYKYSSLRTPANFLVINLAFSDLMTMLTLVPETVYSSFAGGQWKFGYVLCMLHAFCGGLFGYSQIFTLVFISHDRYKVIVKGIGSRPMSASRAKQTIIVIWVLALFWSGCPFFGFGGYSMDGLTASCSFNYMNRDPINVKYILGAVIFNFLTPLLFIMGFYYNIVRAVWIHEAVLREQAKKMNVISLRSNLEENKTSTEIKIAKVAMLNVTLWLIAWTPFAIITLIGVIGNQELLTPLISGIPVVMAKSSCVYNPIIYVISHPKYRQCLKKAFPKLCCCLIREKGNKFGDNQSTATEITKFNEATSPI